MHNYDSTDSLKINNDAGGRTRISQMTTLFDGKVLGKDDLFIWENVGSGVATFLNNSVDLIVNDGEYMIRRGKRIIPYFSGKSSMVEITFDTFGFESGTNKKVGYYSSNNVAPYNSNYDGFFLEFDSTIPASKYYQDNVSLKIFNSGTVVANVKLKDWDNYKYFSGYNWDNFTIVLFDFLWLGGSELRMFIKTKDGFVLAHTYRHASIVKNTFMKSPNQSVRYEISNHSGSNGVKMKCICSQVSTEGAVPDDGKPLSLINLSPIAVNVIGTIYALKGIKKSSTYRDTGISITDIAAVNTTSADAGYVLLMINPTLSAPLTYSTNEKILEANGNGIVTISNPGRVICAIPSAFTGQGSSINNNALASIGMTINDISDEYVLGYLSATNNQSVLGSITIKEY